MIRSENNIISACMPGFGASCALCCGSHNCDAQPEEMDHVYRARGDIIRLYSREYLVRRVMASRSPMTGSYYFTGKNDIELPALPRLFETERCPFIGIHQGTDEIGCLLHGGTETSLRYECFKNYSSKNFMCAAKERLGNAEILFAAMLFRDWYYYSMLIYYRERLVSIMQVFSSPADVPVEVMNTLKAELRAVALSDPSIHRISSYF